MFKNPSSGVLTVPEYLLYITYLVVILFQKIIFMIKTYADVVYLYIVGECMSKQQCSSHTLLTLMMKEIKLDAYNFDCDISKPRNTGYIIYLIPPEQFDFTCLGTDNFRIVNVNRAMYYKTCLFALWLACRII